MEEHGWKVWFCWVKAHAPVLGNELADTLEKQAAMTADITESNHKVSRNL
jgi:ribonuclease HI